MSTTMNSDGLMGGKSPKRYLDVRGNERTVHVEVLPIGGVEIAALLDHQAQSLRPIVFFGEEVRAIGDGDVVRGIRRIVRRYKTADERELYGNRTRESSRGLNDTSIIRSRTIPPGFICAREANLFKDVTGFIDEMGVSDLQRQVTQRRQKQKG